MNRKAYINISLVYYMLKTQCRRRPADQQWHILSFTCRKRIGNLLGHNLQTRTRLIVIVFSFTQLTRKDYLQKYVC